MLETRAKYRQHQIILAIEQLKYGVIEKGKHLSEGDLIRLADGTRNFSTEPADFFSADQIFSLIDHVTKNFADYQINLSGSNDMPDRKETKQVIEESEEYFLALLAFFDCVHLYLHISPETEVNSKTNTIKKALRTALLGVNLMWSAYRVGQMVGEED
jgi:hypothetical protein